MRADSRRILLERSSRVHLGLLLLPDLLLQQPDLHVVLFRNLGEPFGEGEVTGTHHLFDLRKVIIHVLVVVRRRCWVPRRSNVHIPLRVVADPVTIRFGSVETYRRGAATGDPDIREEPIAAHSGQARARHRIRAVRDVRVDRGNVRVPPLMHRRHARSRGIVRACRIPRHPPSQKGTPGSATYSTHLRRRCRLRDPLRERHLLDLLDGLIRRRRSSPAMTARRTLRCPYSTASNRPWLVRAALDVAPGHFYA